MALGSVTRRYDYDAFGNEREITGQSATDANPFRYSGEYFDSETGTIYLRARYYAPGTGRFTSEDPAKDGANWYVYCYGNPVIYIDVSGLAAVEIRAYLSQYNAFIWSDTQKQSAIFAFNNKTLEVPWAGGYVGGVNIWNSSGRMVAQDWELDRYFGIGAFAPKVPGGVNAFGIGLSGTWGPSVSVGAYSVSDTYGNVGAIIVIGGGGGLQYPFASVNAGAYVYATADKLWDLAGAGVVLEAGVGPFGLSYETGDEGISLSFSGDNLGITFSPESGGIYYNHDLFVKNWKLSAGFSAEITYTFLIPITEVTR